MYPKKELAQLVIHACKSMEINHVVISPGSRNAPLIIGFNHANFCQKYSIVDERSAAFFALGIAQQTQKPVALVCTSGSALLNYYPAIAEAFYSKIPLVVLSADRPKYLLNIGDGQTINQENVYANHILFSSNLAEENSIEQNSKILKNTIQIAISKRGPIHINIPFDEPLYETVAKLYQFPEIIPEPTIHLLNEKPLKVSFLETFANQWNSSKRKLVVIGVNYPSELLQTQINHLLKDKSVLVLTETTSNLHHERIIYGIDKLLVNLHQENKEKLQPEILLTFGGLVVSKKIKQYLRKYSPKHHWHIDKEIALDTYHVLNQHLKISIELFFSQFFFLTKPKESNYQNYWVNYFTNIESKHAIFLKTCDYSDLKVFETLLNAIPSDYHLQLSNSSVIRYTQLFKLDNSIRVFCNRGTSGIDGSTSTAIGAATQSNLPTLLITGDISFFYDINGLWNNYLPKNLKIIVINNAGGGIFKILPGPKKSNALAYFETPHHRNAEEISKMFGFQYQKTTTIVELKTILPNFFISNKSPQLLEVFTPSNSNDKILKDYFNSL